MATNEEVASPRNFRRSISECSAEREKIDNALSSERKTRKSETYDDSHDLEDLVTCSIHLGIMENPKKLSCQHAFCYKCLSEYSKRCVELICPICRVKQKINDVDKLPSALVEKQLIEVVMKHRLGKCLEESQSTTPTKDTSYSLKVMNSNTGLYEEPSDPSTHMISILDNPPPYESSESLTYAMMDIETIRENMLKHSQYEAVKRDPIQKIYKHLCHNTTDSTHIEFSLFDINISSCHIKHNQLVLVNSLSNQLMVYSELQTRIFYIYLEDKVVKPEYIRIYRDHLLLTGRLKRKDTFEWVFIETNLNGQVIQKSESFSSDLSDLPMILGFDINQKEDFYYICAPKTGHVRVYNRHLKESQCYELDNKTPEYIAYSYSQKQLWISCPKNQRILILDIETQCLRLFDTDQINKAIPKMIFVTDDEKILFLDIKGNRFIWIKRRNDYILTQKLNIPSANRNVKIKTFQVLPSSMIIVGTDSEILIFQSAKYFSKSRRIFELCNVL